MDPRAERAMTGPEPAAPLPDPRDEVETDDEIPSGRFAIDIARLLDDMRGVDIVVYDLRGRSDITDYFVVASGLHRVHLKAMAGDVSDHFAKRGVRPWGIEGMENRSAEELAVREEPQADADDDADDDTDERPAPPVGGTWILVDYGDCIIHLFSSASRAYYDLDLLWGDAPKVEWSEEQHKGT